MIGLSQISYSWHYKSWQKTLAGYMRACKGEENVRESIWDMVTYVSFILCLTVAKNYQPNNNMIGYVINDKHPKSIRVQCER